MKGRAFLMCKYCRWTTSHPSHDSHKGTSNFGRHLDHQCPNYRTTLNIDGKTPTEIERDKLWNQRAIMSQEKLIDHVLRIVIAGDLSFRHASNSALVRTLKIAFPNLIPPTRQAIAKHLMEGATNARNSLKEYFATLESRVSLALDGWNTRSNKDFLGKVPFEHVTGNVIKNIRWIPSPLHAPIRLVTGYGLDYFVDKPDTFVNVLEPV
jgi:hypothetical protein